ncbi:TRAP transporter large permease subunit [Arenibaculum sp.]|jgi:tripartite ATP-independent transporter DctM subunit|uniref:TRAP transporter large permease n=1 Tax=Arenibaculum sp. TaxID=2865862 RepID=UPI002E11BB85|nr:TRAP transporter large permease subunit [Arenibaculum sp.]
MSNVLLGELIAGGMFVVTIFVIMIGYPVAFTLAGTGLIFAWIGSMTGVLDFHLFTGLASRYFGIMINEILVAVPLFVFMGVMLERSKIAEALLTTMGQLFGAMRGGLGISVILVGGLLAASTGIVGATVVTMGLLSLPAMMRAGYDPKLASGIICASGTLGQIIPPSTVLIFMGDMLQGANQQAQLAMGNFAFAPVSVGQLFAGAMIPGITLVFLYVAWVLVKAIFHPSSCPAIQMTAAERAGLLRNVFVALVPPLILIFTVLGSILSGIATATESASVGAVGAMLMAAMRGRLSFKIVNEVMLATVKISSMVFVILLGASVFSLTFRGLGGEQVVHDMLSAMPGGQVGAVIAVMLLTFVLGFFLDTFEIIFIIVPITAAPLIMLGVDPIWLGVALGVNLQTSFLTPPFGFALFYLRGVASRVLDTMAIYRGVVPFIGLQVVGIVLIWLIPGMATWLPERLFAPGPPAAVVITPRAEGGFGDLFGGGQQQQPGGESQDGQDGFGDLFGSPGGGQAAPQPESAPAGQPEGQPAGEPEGEDDFQDLFKSQ